MQVYQQNWITEKKYGILYASQERLHKEIPLTIALQSTQVYIFS